MLEIRLLGQYDVRQDGMPIEIPSRPARTLLAYLVLTLGTHHPRDRLAGLLWPNSSESNARKNLRQALWRLRKAIGDVYLLVDTVSIAFDPASDFWFDIALLEDTAEKNLKNAVSAYEGELLPGFYEDWVLLERDRLNAAFERKMERLVIQLIREQRWTDALDWAERWIAQGGVPEAAYRALMVSHSSTGELSKVEADYQRCVEALRQEVGVDPSKETADLHKSLLTDEAIPPYPYLEGAEQALLPTVQRLNLPAEPTPFIGRKDELVETKQLLANTRLLTLTGPGGIGKTRLALKLAADVLDHFDKGAHFVSLAPIRTPDHIVQIIADALEFPLSTQDDPEDQLFGYLWNRQLLLVMDNFEHLLDGVDVVSKMLQAAPGVKVLATSREKLGVQGETTIGVVGMGFPDLGTSDDVLAHDAIKLFMQAARRARPGFEPSTRDLEHATLICQMVQGMPLAIELAAAWLDTLSLEEITDELQRSLDILSTEMRDVPDRHRNIRAVFDHSWSLINESEREVFMRLSVFRGGFTREAAQQVADASLKLIAGLVRKSCLRHDASSGRFEIHELMRQYAQERLEERPQTSVSTHEAHAACYASFMHRRWQHLKDDRQIVALDEIDADIENVRTAWRYRVGQRDASQIRLFIHSIRLVYDVRGWNLAGKQLFAEAVEALTLIPADEEVNAVKALALAHESYFMAWLGLAEEGIELARQSADILERLDRRKELVYALNSLTLNARYLKLHDEQERASLKMLEIARENDDEWMLAFALFVMSVFALGKKDYVEARRLAKSSLKISEENGDLIISSFSLAVLGNVAFALEKYAKAREYHFHRFKTSEKVGYRWAMENSIKYLGHVALAMDEIAEAETYFRRSLRIAEEIGLGRDMINLLYEFARVRAAQDRIERAVELLALILEHPASRQTRLGEGRIRDSAQSLLDKLMVELAPETYAAALQRGKALELAAVAAELIE
ncbi:MAG: BTAD domain-containing putative transcriptional regulator [Anaerolineales bacterium]